MHDMPGSGALKFALSLGMMINMSLLLGLTQKDMGDQIMDNIRTIHKSAAIIKKNESFVKSAYKQLAEIDLKDFAKADEISY